jgi:aerobic-type carbon monoxide dehydrogenase small subunit (CoxS/CutS family)
MIRFSTRINGVTRDVECDPGASLFDVLRELGYKSVKQGCDHEGTCGACTVLLDGQAILSCITPAAKASNREVVTVEGVGHPSQPHPLQSALVEAGAVQCGYCTPGMVLASKALLDKVPDPTEEQVKEALSGNLCRCTGYVKILEAVKNAAETMRKEAPHGRK